MTFGSVFHTGLEHVEVTVLISREFVVGSELEHMTVSENKEDIAVADRTKSVSDHNRCSTLHGSVESLLDDLLTLLIQSGSGFVEYQNTRVFDERASDRDSLLLAS